MSLFLVLSYVQILNFGAVHSGYRCRLWLLWMRQCSTNYRAFGAFFLCDRVELPATIGPLMNYLCDWVECRLNCISAVDCFVAFIKFIDRSNSLSKQRDKDVGSRSSLRLDRGRMFTCLCRVLVLRYFWCAYRPILLMLWRRRLKCHNLLHFECCIRITNFSTTRALIVCG